MESIKSINMKKKNTKVNDYPMIRATLKQFRMEEIKMSNDSKRSKNSFSELFEARIDNMKGERENVSITVTVEITKSLFGLEENVFKRTYGLFTVDTVLCKSNESEIRRNTSFVLTNFQGNFERYFAIFLRKFEELSKKCCVVDRKFGKASEISMKRSFERAKYRRIFEEAKRNIEEFLKKRKETWKFRAVK